VKLRDVHVDLSGWLIVTLLVGDVAADDKGLKRELPAAPKPAQAQAPGESPALAVLVTQGVPLASARKLVSRAVADHHPHLAEATAARVAEGCHLEVAYKRPEQPHPPIELRPGDLTDWSKAMPGRLGESLIFSGSLPLDAAALQAAVASGLKDLTIEGAKAGGVLTAKAQDGVVRWTGKDLSYTAGLITRDGVKFSGVSIKTAALNVRPAVAGRPAEADVGGDFKIDRVAKGLLSVGPITGQFTVRQVPDDPGAAAVTFNDVNVKVGDKIVAGRAGLKLASGKVTGTITFEYAGAEAVLELKENGTDVSLKAK
jgi:hypothetical protein